jgi:hypothetical protein
MPEVAAPEPRDVVPSSARATLRRANIASRATEQDTLQDTALRQADTDRARIAYGAAAPICAFGVLVLQLVEGPPAIGPAASIAVGIAGLVCGTLAWRHRDGSMFSDLEASAGSFALCVAVLAAVAHFGPLSAAAMTLVLLVIGLSMGDLRRGKLFFGTIFGGYALLLAAVTARLIPGVTPTLATTSAARVAVAGTALCFIVAASYVYGRAARRATTDAVAKLHRARVELAGREALIQEARADLDRLRVDRHGRLTGQLVNQYRLFELLGRGGSGEVYRAQNTEDEQMVAIKVLHPNLVTDDALVDRFFREARIAASLSSPHLVAVRELGVTTEGAPFIAMELLDGRTLSEILRTEGPLDLRDAVVLADHVAEALATAHDAGIVHRDIKPSNLVRAIQDDQMVWKVVDFGISKLMAGSGTLTQGALLGTPGYMAPEQATGGDVDARADIFGLGAVLYRAITGRPPFSGEDALAIALDAVQRQPVRPSSLEKLPRDVDWVLGLALAKDPAARIASIAELADAFSTALSNQLAPVWRERARAHLEVHPWRDALSGRQERADGATIALR